MGRWDLGGFYCWGGRVYIKSQFIYTMLFLHESCRAAPAGGLKVTPKVGRR